MGYHHQAFRYSRLRPRRYREDNESFGAFIAIYGHGEYVFFFYLNPCSSGSTD